MGSYLPILPTVPRRKPGALLPLEVEILRTALDRLRSGEATFHGFGVSRALPTDDGGSLTAHGTLYKALGRLEEMGLVTSAWEEDPPAGRPRRRLYELTASGQQAAEAHGPVASGPKLRPRLAPGTA